MHIEVREPNPLLTLAARNVIEDLDALLRRLLTGTAYPGVIVNTVGLTATQAERLRVEAPKLMRELKNLCMLQPDANQAELDVIRRIADKVQPDGFGCLRWYGSTQGTHKLLGEGGTPVISYQGTTVPARRLLWQIKFPAGHPNHLLGDERLRKNPECRVGSRCMNMDHWHKGVPEKIVRADRALARDIHQRMLSGELSRGSGTVRAAPAYPLAYTRICRNGHRVDAGGGPKQRQGKRDCPTCRREAPGKRLAKQEARRRRTGMILQNESRAITAPAQPQLPTPTLAALAAEVDFSALIPPPSPATEEWPAWWPSDEEFNAASDEQLTAWFERLEREQGADAPTTHTAAPQSPPAVEVAPDAIPWPAAWADEPEEKIDPVIVMALLDPKRKS